ncbi:polycomb group RING finger protein 2 [Nematostella vectensis]|uniref:polycomb group RING finger protein 2 n=1 Tax=Nematostella vectensis TaxID=45351 RepID=UPI0013903C53|nr:polycomb group RING finger protein 2 [Nematostella vectensis]
MLRTLSLKELNPHIICVLCGGYLVDATTIIECLHSFCRGCIVRYLDTSYRCPVCDAEIHKTRPLLNIRADNVLQDIVYKVVPGMYFEEKKRRKGCEEQLKKSRNPEKLSQEVCDTKTIDKEKEQTTDEPDIEDPICLTLEFYKRRKNTSEQQIFPTRYLRCTSSVTVSVIKKFLTIKFGIPPTHKSELIRSDEILDDNLTMKELTRIYGIFSKAHLDLQYLFMSVKDDDYEAEQEAKRQKLAHAERQRELYLLYQKQQQRRRELEREEQGREQRELDTSGSPAHELVHKLSSKKRKRVSGGHQKPSKHKPGNTGLTTQPGCTRIPTQAGDTGIPTQVGDTEIPTEAGDTRIPTQVGDTGIPTQAGYTGIPTQAGDTVIPTQAGDTRIPTQAGDTGENWAKNQLECTGARQRVEETGARQKGDTEDVGLAIYVNKQNIQKQELNDGPKDDDIKITTDGLGTWPLGCDSESSSTKENNALIDNIPVNPTTNGNHGNKRSQEMNEKRAAQEKVEVY